VIVAFGYFIRKVTLPAYTMLFYWFVVQLLSGVGSLAVAGMGGVAYFAHVGGFASGVVLTLPLRWQKDEP
jgi:membrane associated rhomboid family serine protease